ncbi:endo-1,4-beta-xylanase [Nonomuraea salmonea]|uniref:endo-1,4-beta-xylanase n=1 Tax=Nonomuraea salmonea TaxID=46181 RepID=UPI0031E607AC
MVANEVTDGEDKDANGYWTEEPWYQTIGPSYVEEAFRLAHRHDPPERCCSSTSSASRPGMTRSPAAGRCSRPSTI